MRNRPASTEETWLYRRDTSCLAARDVMGRLCQEAVLDSRWSPAIVNMLASFTLIEFCKGTTHTYAIRKCHPPRSHRDVFLACRVCSGLIFRSSFVCAVHSLCRTNHQLTTAPPYCALLLMFAVLRVGRRCVSQQPSCLAFVDLSNPHVCMLRLPWLTLTCLSR